MRTIFDEVRDEARKEGREEGNQESLVNTFLRLAKAKFQSVPKRVERRVRAASLDQLDNWLLRLISADSLDSVFGSPAKS